MQEAPIDAAQAADPGVAASTATRTATHCPYCAMQCAMDVVREPGERVSVEPRASAGRLGLCRKGWSAAELLDHPERLTTALMRDRRDAPLRPVSWDAALDRVAGAIRDCQERHGRDAVGVFGGGGLTNEKAYALGKFARLALRTSAIDYNGRFCMSSAATASQRAFGLDRGLPFPLQDIAATKVLLLVGSNLAESLPTATGLLDEMVSDGGTLIVVDPRATPTARRARLHLQLAPGTDLALANGLLHIAVRDGLIDERFIVERTAGFEGARQRVGAYWPDRVERITGVPVADQRLAVQLLAAAPTGMVLTARGPEQQAQGTDTVQAFINLALALGLAGRPGCGYGCLTGQGNGQGGREHGLKADQLPGYRRIDDPAAREHVAGVWGVEPGSLPGPGRSAWEMLDALGSDGGVRALLVAASNPAVSAPHAGRVAERLAALDFLCVSDPFLSETADLADVVLPVTQWAEEDGTMTNLEGRVVLRRAAGPPPPGVRSDLEVLAGLAERVGAPAGAFPVDPREVFSELTRASAGGKADYGGMSYERLEPEGLFWPCPDPDSLGTPRPFLERFATPDGRARFVAVSHRGPAEPLDAEFPLSLTTGRVLDHYQSGTQTRRTPELADAEPDAFVELHPVLARRHGIEEGDTVWLASRRGSAAGRARLSPDTLVDMVFMPFHWSGEGCVNRLTNPALDPYSRMPEFKHCAVRVDRVEPRDPRRSARR